MKKSFKILSSLVLTLVAILVLASCSNKKYETAMNNVSLLIDDIWDKNERLDDNNNSLGSFVSTSFTVPYETKVDGEVIAVNYEVSGNGAIVAKKDETKTTTIEVSQTAEVQEFTLTVKIDKVDSKSWDFKVDAIDLSMEKTQAEIDAMDPMTYEEYAAAKSGDSILIQGWITHPHDYSSSYGNASVWLQDENGGYYAYRVAVKSQREWDTYFKVGNKIAIEGKKSPYNGWDEVGSGCKYYFIKDAEQKQFDTKDITSIWGSNAANSKASTAVQNQKVKVTAKVTSIPSYNSEDMILGLSVNGQSDYSAYLKDAYVGSIPEGTFSDLQIGYTIEIEGIVSVTSKGAQVCPISLENFYKITSTEVTDADRVSAIKAQVSNQDIEEACYENSELELLTSVEASGKTVNVKYELKPTKGSGIALIDGNKLVVEVDGINNAEATLTATITCGEATDTYEFKISTKTDKDVLEETVQQFEEDYKTDDPSVILGDVNKFRIYNLPESDIDGVTISYALDKNDYIELKQTNNSHSYYLSVQQTTENLETPITLKLTVTIKYDNPNLETEVLTQTIVKEIRLMKEAASQLDNFYKYTSDGKETTISGFIAYLGEYSEQYKNFTVYLADADGEGGYYGYRAKADKDVYDSLKVGTYVTLKGEKDVYQGGHQLANGKLTVGKTDKEYDGTAVTITAESLADENWVLLHQADFVTVTGTVESVEESWGGRSATLATLKVGDQTICVSINTYIWNEGSSGTPVWEKVKKSLKGMQVTVSGYLGVFKDDTQINVVNPNDYVLPEVTAEQKTEVELNNVKNLFEAVYKNEATVNLPSKGTSYTEVTLEYSFGGTYTTVSIADGKLTINPTATENISLKVKATCAEKVKEITIAFTVDGDKADAIIEYTGTTSTNMAEGNNATKVGVDETVFNITADKGGNNNFPGLNRNGQIRLYGQDGKCNSIKVAVTGKTITKIVINFIHDKNTKASITGHDDVTITEDVSITVEYDTPVTEFVIKNVEYTATSQVWIESIEVYFAE